MKQNLLKISKNQNLTDRGVQSFFIAVNNLTFPGWPFECSTAEDLSSAFVLLTIISRVFCLIGNLISPAWPLGVIPVLHRCITLSLDMTVITMNACNDNISFGTLHHGSR